MSCGCCTRATGSSAADRHSLANQQRRARASRYHRTLPPHTHTGAHSCCVPLAARLRLQGARQDGSEGQGLHLGQRRGERHSLPSPHHLPWPNLLAQSPHLKLTTSHHHIQSPRLITHLPSFLLSSRLITAPLGAPRSISASARRARPFLDLSQTFPRPFLDLSWTVPGPFLEPSCRRAPSQTRPGRGASSCAGGRAHTPTQPNAPDRTHGQSKNGHTQIDGRHRRPTSPAGNAKLTPPMSDLSSGAPAVGGGGGRGRSPRLGCQGAS